MTDETRVQDRMDELVATCRRGGLKVTHQRMEIFRELAGSRNHPSAEEVFERVRLCLPTVSLDTVYRTLAFLEEHGLITRVDVLTDRARFDADTSAHHHLVCTECGRIDDITSTEIKPPDVPAQARGWGEVISMHTQLRGICAECLKGRRVRGEPGG